jgi:hypothetical protein
MTISWRTILFILICFFILWILELNIKILKMSKKVDSLSGDLKTQIRINYALMSNIKTIIKNTKGEK